MKLHWFFKHGELNPTHAGNPFTRKFLRSAGSRELLSLSSDTYDHVDAVMETVPVVLLALGGIPDMPVFSKETWYTRIDFTLMRHWNNGKVTLLQVGSTLSAI